RGTLWHAGGGVAVAGSGTESGDGYCDGVWARSGLGIGGCAGTGCVAAVLPSAAERARGPSIQAEPIRRSTPGVRAGGIAHAQHTRTKNASGSGEILRESDIVA